MKSLLVGIFLTGYFFAFAQDDSENPLKNNRNYKSNSVAVSQTGTKPSVVTKKAVGRNYKKSKNQNSETLNFTNIVQTPEQSLKSRNYKNK